MNSPFPNNPEQILLPMDPAQFKMELGAYETVGYYARELLSGYDQRKLAAVKALRQVATLIRLPETIAQPAKMPMNEQFFYIGGVIGLRAIELEKGPDFAKGLFSGEDSIPVNLAGLGFLPSRDQRMRAVSQSIMAASDAGYLLAEPYHETVEHISHRLCTDIEDQPYVRRGFGLTMFMTGKLTARNLEIARVTDLLVMETEVAAAVAADWDQAWVELGEGA